MLVNAGHLSVQNIKNPPEYTVVRGAKPQFIWENKEHTKWRMVFKANCVIRFDKINSARNVDIQVTSGGHPGGGAYTSQGAQYPGAPGAGGDTVIAFNYSLFANTEISVVIGSSNGASKFADIVASGNSNTGSKWEFNDKNSGRYYGADGSSGRQISNITSGLNGYSGRSNSGNGGDGGNFVKDKGVWKYGNGGEGGTGIVIMRNAR